MLAGILDIVADAVIAVDTEQRIVFFNRGAEQIFGWTADAIRGRSLHEILPRRFFVLHDQHVAAFARGPKHARLMGERQAVFGRRKDGSEFPAEVSIAKIGEGNDLYFMAILRDATERTQQQEALRASRTQLQALSRRLVDALEEERRSIGRNLHDEAAQGLMSLQFRLNALEKDLPATPEVAGQMRSIKQLVGEIQQGLHALAANLRPPTLDKVGLVAALGQYAEAFGRESDLPVSFEAMGMDTCRLSPDAETALYRIAQEALTNVARHARASSVGIIVQQSEGTVRLIVEDNGGGFAAGGELPRAALGLAGMRERAESLGGSLTIESAPGLGTTVYATMPGCAQA